MMKEYHKIQSVFKRDPETNHKTFLEGQYSTPEIEALAGINWIWTEKIDGTNIRADISENGVVFGGRTDRAQIPPFLQDKLEMLLRPEMFELLKGPVTLYGEGYGARIQKGGGDYIEDGVSFILFDVCVDGIWLHREAVRDVAGSLGIRKTPIVGTGPLHEAIDYVQHGFVSTIAEKMKAAEGIVARPECELLDRLGRRIITKIKCKDFA